MISKFFVDFVIIWTSIVGYFTDSPKISAVYGIVTLLIIKESLW